MSPESLALYIVKLMHIYFHRTESYITENQNLVRLKYHSVVLRETFSKRSATHLSF